MNLRIIWIALILITTTTTYAQEKVGFINTNSVATSNPEMMQIIEKLEDLHNELFSSNNEDPEKTSQEIQKVESARDSIWQEIYTKVEKVATANEFSLVLNYDEFSGFVVIYARENFLTDAIDLTNEIRK